MVRPRSGKWARERSAPSVRPADERGYAVRRSSFMKTRILTIAAALGRVAGTAFAQTNVSGDWMVTIQSPQGANTVRVTFKQDGDKVSGIFRGQQGELPFDGGTMTGDDLKFAFSVPFQGAAL